MAPNRPPEQTIRDWLESNGPARVGIGAIEQTWGISPLDAADRRRIAAALESAGVLCEPPLTRAGRNDRLRLSVVEVAAEAPAAEPELAAEAPAAEEEASTDEPSAGKTEAREPSAGPEPPLPDARRGTEAPEASPDRPPPATRRGRPRSPRRLLDRQRARRVGPPRPSPLPPSRPPSAPPPGPADEPIPAEEPATDDAPPVEADTTIHAAEPATGDAPVAEPEVAAAEPDAPAAEPEAAEAEPEAPEAEPDGAEPEAPATEMEALEPESPDEAQLAAPGEAQPEAPAPGPTDRDASRRRDSEARRRRRAERARRAERQRSVDSDRRERRRREAERRAREGEGAPTTEPDVEPEPFPATRETLAAERDAGREPATARTGASAAEPATVVAAPATAERDAGREPATAGTAAEAAPAAEPGLRSRNRVVPFALALLAMAIGSVAPWSKAVFTVDSGFDRSGPVILAIAVLAAGTVALALRQNAKSWLPYIAAALGALSIAIIAGNFRDIVDDSFVDPAWGLYLSFVGSAVLVVLSMFLTVRRD